MKIVNSNNASPVTENSSIEVKKIKWNQNNKKKRSRRKIKTKEQKSEKFFAKNGDTF